MRYGNMIFLNFSMISALGNVGNCTDFCLNTSSFTSLTTKTKKQYYAVFISAYGNVCNAGKFSSPLDLVLFRHYFLMSKTKKMGYKNFVSMNIAIIGVGETAEMYAAGFAFAGHNVYMAWKDNERDGLSQALEAFTHLTICSIEEAAEVADLIIIASQPKDVREVSYWLGDVRKKVIIDATTNVHAADEELVKTICAIRAITGSPHVVKVFHTRGYEELLRPLFGSNKIDMLLVGDSKKAKEITKILAVELEFKQFHDFGGDEAILLFNEMTRCWRNMSKAYVVTQEELAAIRN